MRFDPFWNLLTTDLRQPRHFTTLSQGKRFDSELDVNSVVVQPNSSAIQRRITRLQFYSVWQKAKSLPEYEQFRRSNYNEINRNGSYILSMMRHYLGEERIE